MKSLIAAKHHAKNTARTANYPVFVVDYLRIDPDYSALYGRYGVMTWPQYGASALNERDIVGEF